MSPDNLDKLIKEGPSEVVDFYDLIHSPEFEEFIKDENWDEYKQYDFQ